MEQITDLIVKATYLEDLKSYLVYLPGGMYKVDMEVINRPHSHLDSIVPVQLESVDDIFKLGVRQIITHYIDSKDPANATMDVDRYNADLDNLRSKSSGFDGDEYRFSNLDDEYNHKLFIQRWIPATQTITTSTSKVVVQLTKTAYNHNLPHCLSNFDSNVEGQRHMVLFDRMAYERSVFNTVVQELGIQSKVTDPAHSHLRFIQIYGKYIFSDDWREKPAKLYTTEAATVLIDDIKSQLHNIVKSTYNLHNDNLSQSMQLSDCLTSLQQAVNYLDKVISTSKTREQHIWARNSLTKAHNILLSETAK